MEASEHTYSRYLHTVLPTPGFAQIAPLPLPPVFVCVCAFVWACVGGWVFASLPQSVSQSVSQSIRQSVSGDTHAGMCVYLYVCLPTYAREHMCMCV